CGEVYPGINLLYYCNQQNLEYDFTVQPGRSIRSIGMAYSGIRELHINPSGDLVLTTAVGEIRQKRPRIYQEDAGTAREVAGGYILRDRNTVGFQVGDYDKRKTLVIDPILTYSTFVGGNQDDTLAGVGVDNAGNVYVAGNTKS